MSSEGEVFCPTCVERQATLGEPSHARWIGPDGGVYCSLHFIQRFGHAERLIPIADYVAPTKAKAPLPKKPAAKPKEQTEVKA